MSDRRIYLDHHATTPVDRRVLDAMLPYFTEAFGNPASRSHAFGREADCAIAEARGQIANMVGARSPREIVFTSGATESNNLALKGVLEGRGGGHIITSTIEHSSVQEVCCGLEGSAVACTEVGVDSSGIVSPGEIEASIRPDTALISIMSVNNEVGTIQPIGAIGAIARRRGVLFHTDAAQAAGRLSIDVERDSIDLLSVSAHKLYGPKGVGALFVRSSPRHVTLRRQTAGGSQERGLRSGTLNVPGIVGFGVAGALAANEGPGDARRLAVLRDDLLSTIRHEVPDVQVHGSLSERVSGNLNISFPGIEGEVLLMSLPNIALSAGSACTSGNDQVSHVLAAMGVPTDLAKGAIRIGLGRFTTQEEVRHLAARLVDALERLRARRRRTAQRPTVTP